MDIKEIRALLNEGHSVVLLEEGQTPLMVTKLPGHVPQEVPEEVPIASRWPKARVPVPDRQDQILERLNTEILALKAQIVDEEGGSQG